jgi:hypothetical protein
MGEHSETFVAFDTSNIISDAAGFTTIKHVALNRSKDRSAKSPSPAPQTRLEQRLHSFLQGAGLSPLRRGRMAQFIRFAALDTFGARSAKPAPDAPASVTDTTQYYVDTT